MESKPIPVGDFSGPAINAPRTPVIPTPPVLPSAAPEEPNGVSDEKIKSVAAAIQGAAQPPTQEELATQYLEGLTRAGITIDDARRIMDEILLNDVYTEAMYLRSDVRVVFRTRDYNDTQRMLRIAESEAPRIPTHFQDIIARCNLAASLVSYRDKSFERPARKEGMSESEYRRIQEEAFQVRLAYVMGLPTPVTERLMELLAKFDNKLMAVLSEGAPQDF